MGNERLYGVQAAIDSGHLPQRPKYPLAKSTAACGRSCGVQRGEKTAVVTTVVTMQQIQ
jgi:hypothetical protein